MTLVLFANTGLVRAQSPTPPPGQTTQGDQVVVANTYRLAAGDTLNGNLGLIGSTAFIENGAVITKGVFVVGGTISISGTVRGDIIAIGGAVNLDDTAVAEGDITVIGATINRSPLAKVYGQIIQQTPTILDFNFNAPAGSPLAPRTDPAALILRIVLDALLMAVVAVIAALLLPEPVKRVANVFIEQPAVAGGVGLLVVVGFPLVLLLMIVTVLLIPMAALAVLALGVVLLYGWIAIGYELGRKIGELFHSTWAPAVNAGIGTLILVLVTSAASLIPCLGAVIIVLISLFAIGSVVMARFGSARYRPIPRTTTTTAQPPIDLPPAS